MIGKLLKAFFENEAEREAVKSFLIQYLSERAVDKVFKRENTEGVAEAKEHIDKAFDKLAEIYGKIEKPKDQSPR